VHREQRRALSRERRRGFELDRHAHASLDLLAVAPPVGGQPQVEVPEVEPREAASLAPEAIRATSVTWTC
ncbi:MAG: hypothetical protein M3138_11135, partial [Actinomycetota bacterium]|nr:hypothetical protein [Actinomycetota bacterium]